MEIEEIVNLVKTRDKRVGLRILYKKHKVKKEDRQAWRDLWDKVREDLDVRGRLQET